MSVAEEGLWLGADPVSGFTTKWDRLCLRTPRRWLVDTSCEAAHVLRVFDDQEVDIAVGPHVASGYGPEEE